MIFTSAFLNIHFSILKYKYHLSYHEKHKRIGQQLFIDNIVRTYTVLTAITKYIFC